MIAGDPTSISAMPIQLGDFDGKLASVELLHARLRNSPTYLLSGDEVSWVFPGNLELRVDYEARTFSLRDHGCEKAPVEPGTPEFWGMEDVSHSAFWFVLQDGRWIPAWFPQPTDENELEIEVDECGHVAYLRYDDGSTARDSECVERERLIEWKEWESSDECAYAMKSLARFRRDQLRVVRKILVDIVPHEIKRWITRMRFPWLSFADVSMLWKHLEEARCIAEDNIKLLSVWLWSGVDLVHPREWDEYWRPGTPDPFAVKRLRQRILAMGIPPRMWRLACRIGPKAFTTQWENLESRARLEQALNYLRLLAFDDAPRDMPEAGKREIGFLAFVWGSRVSSIYPGLVRAALRHLRQLVAERSVVDFFDLLKVVSSFDFAELQKVVSSFDSQAQLPLDANQRNAGWNWWLRQHHRIEAQRNEAVRNCKWSKVIEPFETGLYEVVPLSDAPSLIDEGDRMHNCLGSYVERCMAGARIFSIKRTSDAKSMADVELEIVDGAALVVERAGFAGRCVPVGCEGAIEELVERCSMAMKADQMDCGNEP